MDLRRFAQTKNASTAGGTPRRDSTSDPASPISSAKSPPSTPLNRVAAGAYRSPASTPSISSSVPFDWEAVRSRRPPPYQSPLQAKIKGPRKSTGTGTNGPKRYVKKKGIIQKMMDIPSWIAFEIAIFPNNLPLPSATTSAFIVGGTMHFLHLLIRVQQVTKVPDSDLGWEDMYREGNGQSWFDWTIPVSLLLIAASFFNSVLLFSRIKLYRLHHQSDPVSSPNAMFVSAQLDFEPLEPPSLLSRLISGIWYSISYSFRWLLGMSPPSIGTPAGIAARVQQLQVWTPGDLEMKLFCVYSPAHAFLWMATGSSNWMLMTVIMGLVGIQLNAMMYSYNALMKDKDIIASEVMHEYNQGFVYPRINPIRRDVAVMTHQSEVVNVWED